MTANFEEEGRLTTETVTRPRSNPSVGVATVFIVLTAIALGLMWYVSLRKKVAERLRGDVPHRQCAAGHELQSRSPSARHQ